jgi:hypothetical protein
MKAKGIRYNPSQRKWTAALWYDGKNIHIGSYKTFEDAVRAKREMADLYRLGLSDEDLFGQPIDCLTNIL